MMRHSKVVGIALLALLLLPSFHYIKWLSSRTFAPSLPIARHITPSLPISNTSVTSRSPSAPPSAPSPAPRLLSPTPTPNPVPRKIAEPRNPWKSTCTGEIQRPTPAELAQKKLTPQMNFLSEYLCERMDCVNTRGMVLQQVQSIKICVHENSIDQHVSGSLRSKGMWEEHIVTPFLHLVKRFPQAVVLDLGAQLGVYGLLAARAGSRVIFVEASPHNANHILHSLSQNFGIENVGLGKRLALLRNALGSSSGDSFRVTYEEQTNNGGTKWRKAGEGAHTDWITQKPAADGFPPQVEGNHEQEEIGQRLLATDDNTSAVNSSQMDVARRSSRITQFDSTSVSIKMDDLLPLLELLGNVNEVIIKIDIEGAECDAFKGATNLLREKRIRGIFMEFGQLKGMINTPECSALKEAIFNFHKNGLKARDPGSPHTDLGGASDASFSSWPWDVMWV